MSNDIVVHGDDIKETPQMKRSRLAAELRFLSQQYNSKVAELLETGVDVHVKVGDELVENRHALIGTVEVSYQTPRKFY